MGIFNRLFQKQTKEDSSIAEEPNILFGRYTDRNKTKEQYDSWDKSINLFKAKKYLDAYCEFFNYLTDPKAENVICKKETNKITFSLIQGSKVVHGTISNQEIQAEAEVASFEQQNVAVMRKLLQENYYLYFSKFAVRNNIYTLKYYSPSEDAHPSSLYYALKELATEADMYDDVLVEEFEMLHAINTEHVKEIPESEKQIKLKHLRQWINGAFEQVEKLDSDKFTGAIAYYLLNLTFKMYYLLAPEGTLLDDLRFIQSIFYREDDKTPKEKNYHIVEEFKRMSEKTDGEILKSLYKIKATFAVARPTNHKTVADFFNNEIEKARWYIENKHPEIVTEICEYIVSYACFSFGMPAVANDMLMVLWRVFNPTFFIELGFQHVFYDVKGEKLNRENIEKRIHHIISHSKKRHPKVEFDTEKLNFSSKNEFAMSFFKEFKNLNYD